MNTQTLNKK